MEWVLPPPKLVCSSTTGSPPWRFNRNTAWDTIAQALGKKCPAEKLGGILVLVRSFALINLPQVGRELGLLISCSGGDMRSGTCTLPVEGAAVRRFR